MTSSETEPASQKRFTRFAELDAVLDILVRGVRERLAGNFVGAYLQGSFAIGDADAGSDCDFIVAVEHDLTSEEIRELDQLHEAIHRLPYVPWRHRLEGSYAPLDVLRRWTSEPSEPPGAAPRAPDWLDAGTGALGPRGYPFIYLNHGARSLVRSEHDDTQVVRWSLREKGIVLAGPHPRDLVDPVTPAELSAEMGRITVLCLAVDLQPMERVCDQTFWVGLFCRILHTTVTGSVASKKVSAVWAAESLDQRWRGLIERSLAARALPEEQRISRADPADVVATRQFVAHVVGRETAAGAYSLRGDVSVN
jgi:hypothetical protein